MKYRQNFHLLTCVVIHLWDFKQYPVSNFSLDILNTMSGDPVFNVGDLNPDLPK
jgi:hypothetical protein